MQRRVVCFKFYNPFFWRNSMWRIRVRWILFARVIADHMSIGNDYPWRVD